MSRGQRGPGRGEEQRALNVLAESVFVVRYRILRFGYKIFNRGRKDLRELRAEMSLESLFQHIIFAEHQAEQSRRVLRKGLEFPVLRVGF